MIQEELNKIIENHQHWINQDCKDWGSMRADLIGADLSGLDLQGVDLSYADLTNTNLIGANLSYANLRGVHFKNANLEGANLGCSELIKADLRCANLNKAKLNRTNLQCANLKNANLSHTELYGANFRYAICDVISVGNIGSRRDTTYYFYKDDRVICGCFDGTMSEFKNKIKDTYEKNDKHYKEYILAVEYLEKMAKLEGSFN